VAEKRFSMITTASGITVTVIGVCDDDRFLRVRYPDGREGDSFAGFLKASGGRDELQKAVEAVRKASK